MEEEIRKEANKFDGLRIIGPNCLGVISPHSNLNASFAASMPEKGHIAFISQSGAICTSVLDWAMQGTIGFFAFRFRRQYARCGIQRFNRLLCCR